MATPPKLNVIGATSDAVSQAGSKPYFIDTAAENHILNGDATGGGHRAGTGMGGKTTEFPATWSDTTIKSAISDIANDSGTQWSQPDDRGYVTGTGTRDGINIKVVVDTTTRRVVTGYPLYANISK